MNSYDFLQSLGQVDGRLIDETMDCMFKNEEKHGKNGGAKVFKTLLVAALIASLFTVSAFATYFLGFREAIVKTGSIGAIPDITVTGRDGSKSVRDMSESAGVSMTKPETGPEELDWVKNVNAAADEWTQYRNAQQQAYIDEKLPNTGKYLLTNVQLEFADNGDKTYTVMPVKEVDWSSGEIIYEDESSFFIIDEEELNNMDAFYMTFGGEYQGKYDWNYGVWDETSEAVLEEIAAKYGLRLRDNSTELYWDERAAANGADPARCFSPAELARMLTERCCNGDFFTVTPSAFDKLYFINTGSFGLSCELPVSGGADISVYIRNTVSDELATGNEISSIVNDYTEYVTRTRTAPDGTGLYIAQGESSAYIYAYLDGSFLVMHVGINPYGVNPELRLTEEHVNQVADSFNYKNLRQ